MSEGHPRAIMATIKDCDTKVLIEEMTIIPISAAMPQRSDRMNEPTSSLLRYW